MFKHITTFIIEGWLPWVVNFVSGHAAGTCHYINTLHASSGINLIGLQSIQLMERKKQRLCFIYQHLLIKEGCLGLVMEIFSFLLTFQTHLS